MRRANSLVIMAVGALLTLLASADLSSAQMDQGVFQVNPDIRFLENNTNVRPTAGVEEYTCDSDKGTCRCTTASDCNQMKKDKVCATDTTACVAEECQCNWQR